MSSRLPKISIVTPSYNQGQYLEQTIDSVLSQGYPNLEYFVMDGGSTDASVSIIKKYAQHLTHWVSEPDKGQSDAINKGMQLITGDVFNWLNSDDYYQPRCLFFVGETFLKEGTQVVCGKSNIVDESGGIIAHTEGTDFYPGNLARTIGQARIDQPETFFSTNAIKAMGPLNTALNYVMDKEWWIRYLLIYGLEGIRQLDLALVNFRKHESSKTVSQQEGFIEESAALFSDLAQRSNWKEAATFLANMSGGQATAVLDSKEGGVSNELLESAVNYQLLYLADRAYWQVNTEFSKKCLYLIKPELLNTSDLKLYNSLRYKVKHFPRWLLKTNKLLKTIGS